MTPDIDLSIRNYGEIREPDRHDYAQLVLPLQGSVLLDIEGKEGRLDPLRAAFVAPGAWHSQLARGANRSIVVDIAPASLAPEVAGRLLEQPFRQVNAAAGKLIEFMGIMASQQAANALMLGAWTTLVLDTLTMQAARPRSRLAALTVRIEAEPGLPWTTESMARQAGLSVSRLHALFRSELDCTPHGWLLEARLKQVRDWLARGDRPIAEIACLAGFSDQSALTRAMRNATGLTPAAYRRQGQENKPKT